MTIGANIVKKALEARTLQQAEELQELIEKAVGARHERPLGDRWNNFGLIGGAGGNYDHKLIENVTNMQDALLERRALQKFGDLANVPYQTPHEASAALLEETKDEDVLVEFYESDPPARETKKLTPVFRDHGCGMTPAQIPETIFALGSSHKEEINWFQGAFGLGGETTYRNTQAAVLVTRRAPELLVPAEENRIAVAVLLWQSHGKTQSAYYLVDSCWQRPGDQACPYSCPADEYPAFSPGTHLALVSYGVEGFHRARGGGDERSFEAILNTRLFRPVSAVSFSNKITEDRAQRTDKLRGLNKRLLDNPRKDRREGEEILPFTHGGQTYQLPVRFYVFSKRGEAGERRNFVAYDHAVIFTSNGQVHYHWTPQKFKYKTRLSKLYDRIFVEVDTDDLPIELRTSLFTADRSELVRNDPAVELENAVAGFLDECDELRQINSELIREAIMSRSDSRPTINIAKQISRALAMKGFSLGGSGSSGGGSKRSGNRGKRKEIELLNDPTTLEGPKHVVAEDNKTKFINFILNTEDDFLPVRGQIEVSCTHPEITSREFSVGPLRRGRFRISVAVPAETEPGEFQLRVSLKDWLKHAGGIGEPLQWITEFEVVPEGSLANGTASNRTGKSGGSEGSMVALIWKNPDQEEEWDKTTVGDVELVSAQDLAESAEEYKELATMGGIEIPTLKLNERYYVLKRYIDARASMLTQQGLDKARDRYAVGVGVGLCMLYKEAEKRREKEEVIDETLVQSAHQSLARGVLSMMPQYDELAKQAGMEGFE